MNKTISDDFFVELNSLFERYNVDADHYYNIDEQLIILTNLHYDQELDGFIFIEKQNEG
jgi:hypothetical protein